MQCPFLREAKVRFCEASPYKRMILDAAGDSDNERCSSPGYAACPDAAAKLADGPRGLQCPFLRDALMEFCAGSPVTKYIPANDALLSRCRSEGHRYCDLFVECANPGKEATGIGSSDGNDTGGTAGSRPAVRVLEHLGYAPNHMWLDVAEDGLCHVGVDAFLASVVGAIDDVSFGTARALDRPVAVLQVNGVDFQMVFPNALRSIMANVNLRANASRVTEDPYGSGWLFEGMDPVLTSGGRSVVQRGLIYGRPAIEWIRLEMDRIDRFVHDYVSRPDAEGARMMADGGIATDCIAARLDRQSLFTLFNEFFAPKGAWR